MSILGSDDYDIEDMVVGEEEEEELEGARIRLRRPRLLLPPKPAWRKKSVAPGVEAPGPLLQPLPLMPDQNGGVFDTTHTSILYTANPQRPYRPQRLVVDYTQGPSSGIQLRIMYINVGVDVQSVQIGDMPAAAFRPTAFGVGLRLRSCQPGVLVQVRIEAVGAFAVGPPAESIPCAVMFLGASIA